MDQITTSCSNTVPPPVAQCIQVLVVQHGRGHHNMLLLQQLLEGLQLLPMFCSLQVGDTDAVQVANQGLLMGLSCNCSLCWWSMPSCWKTSWMQNLGSSEPYGLSTAAPCDEPVLVASVILWLHPEE
jgi:hypothetical protein